MKLARKTSFALLLVCSLATTGSFSQSPTFTTRYGEVQGSRQDGINIFKGIPFARPPIGELRWKAPMPPEPWKGVKKCLDFSASPIQPAPMPFSCWTEEFIAPPSPLSEDCLYLNVWTGASGSKDKRPVFVWIYGGGFVSGSSACAIYDGNEYAKRGIVFVSINYRVGALGFMAHPELTKEGHGSSGNYGLLDQIAALKWVKENISAFGGDPGNVTIAGQSAGAMSVNALIASPLAAGLFQKAIAESGGILGGFPFPNLEKAEQDGLGLEKALGVSSLADMRALPADSILRVSSKLGGIRFSPELDGVVLPVDIDRVFRGGHFNQVNFMSGWVTGDGALFGSQKPGKDQFVKTINERYGSRADRLIQILPHETPEEGGASMSKLTLVSFAVSSPCRLSGFNSKPSYIYEFSHVPVDKPGFPNYGAFHTSEVPYALHTLHLWKRPWTKLDYSVEETMSGYWINFIKTGDPNGKALPKWNAFQQTSYMEIGDVTGEKPNAYKELLEALGQ